MRNLERSQTKMAIYQRERNRKIKSGEWVVKARGPRNQALNGAVDAPTHAHQEKSIPSVASEAGNNGF